MQQFCDDYVEACRDRDVPAHPQVLYAASALAVASSADLVVDGVTLGVRGTSALSSSLHLLPALAVISLRDCYLGDDGACKLAQAVINSTHCKSLRRIELAGNGLHGDGSLSSLGLLVTASPNLEELNLEWNRLGLVHGSGIANGSDYGGSSEYASFVPAHSHHPSCCWSLRPLTTAVILHQSLSRVNLANNQLGGQAVAHEICDVLNRAASLESLDLSWNNFGPFVPAMAEALLQRRVDYFPRCLHRVALHGNGACDPVALAVVEGHLQRVALHRARLHFEEQQRQHGHRHVQSAAAFADSPQIVTPTKNDVSFQMPQERQHKDDATEVKPGPLVESLNLTRAWELAAHEASARLQLVEETSASAFAILAKCLSERCASFSPERKQELASLPQQLEKADQGEQQEQGELAPSSVATSSVVDEEETAESSRSEHTADSKTNSDDKS